MNESLKKVIVSIVFLGILTVTLANVSNVFVFSHENTKFLSARDKQMNEIAKEDIDAYFLGGSKVLRGVIPIVIWKETGLKSVNLASLTQPPIVTRELVKKYVELNRPKYVFIDPSGIQTDSSLSASKTYRYTEGFEFIGNHFTTLQVLKELKHEFPNDDITEFVIPLYRDHTRWNSLKRSDFIVENNYKEYTLGFTNTLPITKNSPNLDEKLYYEDYDYSLRYNQVSLSIYEDIIDYLKEQNIGVYIIALPDHYEGAKYAMYQKFAQDNGLVFLDFSIKDTFNQIGFNYSGDFYDKGHLSPAGALKFSKFLGQTIKELNLDLNPNSDIFNELYDEYIRDMDVAD